MATNDRNLLDFALERLQGLWSSSLALSQYELEVRGLERCVREYRRQDPVMAFYLLGLAATLRRKEKEVRSHFKNALIHSGYDPGVRCSYAACLSRMGLFQEACGEYEILHRQDPEDLGVLAELIVSSLAMGEIQSGLRWIDIWSRIRPVHASAETEMSGKSRALETLTISADHVERLQSLALQILEKERKEIRTARYRGYPLAGLRRSEQKREVRQFGHTLGQVVAADEDTDRENNLLFLDPARDRVPTTSREDGCQ